MIKKFLINLAFGLIVLGIISVPTAGILWGQAATNQGAVRADGGAGAGAGGVATTRAINTTAPLTGGGDLSADRTLALTTSPASQTPVGVTRSVATTAPLSGGGDLSADRTLTTSMATNKLIGRGTAGTGVMEEITLGTNLSFAGTTLNATGSGGITAQEQIDMAWTRSFSPTPVFFRPQNGSRPRPRRSRRGRRSRAP